MVALLVLAFVLLLVPAASGGRAGGTPVAFVAAEDDDRLVAVDLTTRRMLARIRVPDGPHNVTGAGGARWILVTSPPAGTVTLVDAFSRKVVKVWRGFGSPHDVEVDGDRAYVTDEERGMLVVIELRSRRILARLRVGAGAHDVAVGDQIVVTHGAGEASLTLARGRIRRVAAEGAPHDVTKQPDSANVYVTYWNESAVGAVDWGRERVLWKRRVGSLVHHVELDPFRGWRLWATDNRSGRTYFLSARDGRVLRTLSGCPGAHHVAFGGTAWVAVACHDADALAVYRTGSWRRSLVRVGGGPHGVAVAVVP